MKYLQAVWVLGWLAFMSLVLVPRASAQAEWLVRGTVSDVSGATLGGARVEALRGARVVARTVTGQDGTYRLELTVLESHLIQIQMNGFVTGVAVVDAAEERISDFQLEIAPLNDFLVVTPSRTAESRVAVTESHSIITAEDIRASGSSSLADIIQQLPGMNVASTGRAGALTSLFARGGESDYNHVLIDGVRVNVSGGQFDFSRVSATEIEHVEVVRGAQSALYGSDAIGSVVQIFSRRGHPAEPPRVYGSVESGTFNTVRSDLRLIGGARGRVDYQVGAAYRGTEGAFEGRLEDPDRFDHSSIDASIGAFLGDAARLRVAGRYSNARGQAVGAIAYGPGDDGTRADSEDYSGHATLNHSVNAWFTQSATVTYFRHDRISNDEIADAPYNVFTILAGEPGALFPDSPRLIELIDESRFNALVADPSVLADGQFLASTPFGVFDFPFMFASEFRRNTFEYQGNVTWSGNQVLSVGYEYEGEKDPMLERDPSAAGFQVDDHAYFAQQQFVVADNWYATAGVRVDENSRFGTEASPKLSFGGYPVAFRDRLVSSVKLFTNVGRGIKNPTFFELFGSGFVDGNRNLNPERARTFDAGAEVTFDAQRWLSRVTWFDNSYTSQVAFRFSPGFGGDGVPDYLNIAGSHARGVELEGGLQRPIGGVTANVSYSYVDTDVVATASTSEQFQPGQPLLQRPRHSGYVGIRYTRGRGGVHLNVRVTGRRHDAAFLGLSRHSDGVPVDITVNPGYTLVSVGGQYRVRDDVTLFVRADNVTDERYQSALGYPGLPRTFVVGGRFSLGQ